ncbi:MAG: tRNA (adenosine(37)-N6)-dimethylallyltransferase MiaA [Negativicutes bacterium]|nr:tRNA (adenosine(37)-N6)-dimethylallyltransferase MiaA [Negativicutes bacterium]
MDRLIVILGPTAVGKTRVSIDLAKILQTEIISGDSMLIYRGLDIGTAKPSPVERDGIMHQLVDILDPDAAYSVVDFQTQASRLIATLNSQDKIPILAGGTGLYIKSLLEGYHFTTVTGSEEVRSDLAKLADLHGKEHLHALLTEVSPDTAARLHPNDLRRVIRALEVHQLSGETVSTRRQAPTELLYNTMVLGLTMSREHLYQRINQRVDAMLAAGLVAEVSKLLAAEIPADSQALQGIGYKEIVAFLDRQISLETAIEQIKQATRNFAKRQMTWFRKMPYIHWVDVEAFQDHDEMMAYIYSLVAGKFALK